MLSNTCAVSLFVLDPFQIMIRKENCFTWNNLCLSYWAAKSILQSQSECKKNFDVESLKDVVLVANRWGRLSDAECKAKLEKLHCPGNFLAGAVEKKAHLAHNIEHTVDSVPLLVHEEIDSRRITLTAWAWVSYSLWIKLIWGQLITSPPFILQFSDQIPLMDIEMSIKMSITCRNSINYSPNQNSWGLLLAYKIMISLCSWIKTSFLI